MSYQASLIGMCTVLDASPGRVCRSVAAHSPGTGCLTNLGEFSKWTNRRLPEEHKRTAVANTVAPLADNSEFFNMAFLVTNRNKKNAKMAPLSYKDSVSAC